MASLSLLCIIVNTCTQKLKNGAHLVMIVKAHVRVIWYEARSTVGSKTKEKRLFPFGFVESLGLEQSLHSVYLLHIAVPARRCFQLLNHI